MTGIEACCQEAEGCRAGLWLWKNAGLVSGPRREDSCPAQKASERPTANSQALSFPGRVPQHTFPAPYPAESSWEQARWRGLLSLPPPHSQSSSCRCLCAVRFLCFQAHSLQSRRAPAPVPRDMWELDRATQSDQEKRRAGWVPWLSPKDAGLALGVLLPPATAPQRACLGQLSRPRPEGGSTNQPPASPPPSLSPFPHSRVCGGGGFSQTCI